jgi:DHA1 family multidrug resistance protein-like MFS transporter
MTFVEARLSRSEADRGLRTAIAMWFLMNTGFYIIVPLLSVHFVDDLGWAAAFVGTVLATRQFVQQSLTMFGGALSDRFGPKRLIVLGIFIRSLSFAIMGFAEGHAVLLLAAVMAAIGGALFSAPTQATLASLAPVDALSDSFAKLGVFQNLARTVGPLIGAMLIRLEFHLVGLAASAFFLLALFVALSWLPDIRLPERDGAFKHGLTEALSDRRFVVYTALMMGFWFMWVQLSLALPLRATELTGRPESVGILFSVNAFAAVILQVPVLRVARRFLLPLPMLIFGMILMGGGLGSVALVKTGPQLYVSVFFFALGSVLVMPNAQTVAATMADPAARGAYFGVNSLALAIGGGIGQIAGGTLVDLARTLSFPALPWLTSTVVGIGAAFGLILFYRRHRAVVTPRSQLAPSGS